MKRILILEDETPAYHKLIGILESIIGDSFYHDWAKSKSETKHFLLSSKPYDLIVADIQLRDGLSFEVFSEITIECPIIFCTAYNDYLLDAFNTNGIAYVLKPYSEEQLQKAIEKYQTLFSISKQPAINKEILASLEEALQTDRKYKIRFVIKKQNKSIHLLPTNEVSIIEANGDFSKIYSKNGQLFIYSENIGSIVQKLNPKEFFRINRSVIVQLSGIEKIEPHFKNRLILKIKGYPEQVITSSNITAEFRKWLEG